MEAQRIADGMLLKRNLGSNGLLVVIEVIYFISGVGFGFMGAITLLNYILVVNMFLTSLLLKNLLVSRDSEDGFLLNSEKFIYYPITRLDYLKSKYAKVFYFLMIQYVFTVICLGLGYLGNKSVMSRERVIASLIVVTYGILITSGCILIMTHFSTMGLYIPLILIIPYMYVNRAIMAYFESKSYINNDLSLTIGVIGVIIVSVWLLLFVIAKFIYDKKNI